MSARQTPYLSESFRELHSRVTDGIHVRLMWHELNGRVAVAVSDGRTGEAFTIDVLDGDRPMDVFHHPFAYAGLNGASPVPPD